MDNTPPPPTPTPPPAQPSPAPPQVPDAPESDSASTKEGIFGILSTVGLLLLAPLIALFLTAFVFQSYEVDGPSMQTTLQNHDRLIVYKLPRTISRITHHPYVPHRGDIVIFNHPEGVSVGDSSKQLIKRVIGLPGERVVIKDGSVTIYNKDNPNGFSPDKTMSYGSVIGETVGDVDLTVPQDEIFVCGDNRGNSLDSRYFGTVPVSDVVGKLGLRVYPLNKAKHF